MNFTDDAPFVLALRSAMLLPSSSGNESVLAEEIEETLAKETPVPAFLDGTADGDTLIAVRQAPH